MERASKMNFVFFVPDELRAESVGCYGHPLSRTPNMDRLAGEGTRFDQCHVQHTVCTPARCAFMTGWYPHVRGHRTLWHLLRPDEPNLLKYLKQSGYHIYWGGKNDLFAPGSFAESVTDYRLGDRSRRAVAGNRAALATPPWQPDDPRYYSFLYEPADSLEELGDFRQVDGAIELLRGKPEEPFALYLPLSYPHPPYRAPEPWQTMFDPAGVPPLRPADLPDRPDFHALIRATRHLDRLDESVLREINAVYLGMTTVADTLLGQLLDALDETGCAETTAVFCFSDHGDWAGDYGLVEKWPSALDDTLTRVPFIARVPGMARGHVVAEPIELFDFMATVLDLAEIPAAHAFRPQPRPATARGSGRPGPRRFRGGRVRPARAAGIRGARRRGLLRRDQSRRDLLPERAVAAGPSGERLPRGDGADDDAQAHPPPTRRQRAVRPGARPTGNAEYPRRRGVRDGSAPIRMHAPRLVHTHERCRPLGRAPAGSAAKGLH